jgi:putative ABC transport system permease protein
MLILEVVRQAWTSLVTHRFRAGLTMLGIAWGIVTVVILLAYGQGFHRALLRGFQNAFSRGTVVIWGGQTSTQAGGERAGRRIWLKDGDVEALRELGALKYVSPEIMESLPIGYGTRQTTAGVRGVAPEYAVMRTEVPDTGRFINAEDVELRRRVAFLGSEVARRLFSNIPPVGETIRVGGLSFEVVGVLDDKVQISNYFYPDKLSVFIPHTVTRQLWYQDYVDDIVVQTLTAEGHAAAMKQVRDLLAERHRFDPADERAIRVNDALEGTAMLSGMATGLLVVLSFIGALTLLIGGVGVMNIMLVSVNERTREIGLRKALGARRRQILVQFLLEALAITFAGGLLGILISWGVAELAGPRPFVGTLFGDAGGETDIHLRLSPGILLTASGILVFTGIVSGLWPAVRASRLDPIEALRYE